MKKFVEYVIALIEAIANSELLADAADYFGWWFNLPSRIGRKGNILWNRGYEKDGIAPSKEAIGKRYAECMDAKLEVEAEAEKVARKLGLEEERKEAEEEWREFKNNLPEDMKGKPMREYAESAKVLEIREKLEAASEEYKEAKNRYGDIVPCSQHSLNVLKRTFGAFKSYGSEWEELRFLTPGWAIKQVNRAAKLEMLTLGKESELSKTNGIWTDDDRSDITEEERNYKTIMSVVGNLVRPEEVGGCEGNYSAVIDLLHNISVSDEKQKWAIAHRMWALYDCGFIDIDEFATSANFESNEEAQKFADKKAEWALDWLECSRTGKVNKLTGDLAPLSLEANYNFFKEGCIANVRGAWKEEIADTPDEELSEFYFGKKNQFGKWRGGVPATGKVNFKLTRSELVELGKKNADAKKYYKEAAENARNSSKFRKALLSTKNWEFVTSDKTWNKFLSDFRNELVEEKKKIQFNLDISGRIPEDAGLIPDSYETFDAARLDQAWKIINDNVDEIKRWHKEYEEEVE